MQNKKHSRFSCQIFLNLNSISRFLFTIFFRSVTPLKLIEVEVIEVRRADRSEGHRFESRGVGSVFIFFVLVNKRFALLTGRAFIFVAGIGLLVVQGSVTNNESFERND